MIVPSMDSEARARVGSDGHLVMVQFGLSGFAILAHGRAWLGYKKVALHISEQLIGFASSGLCPNALTKILERRSAS